MAASAPSTRASRKTSAKCCHGCRRRRRRSAAPRSWRARVAVAGCRSLWRTPSWFMQLRTISPAPRSCTSRTQSTVSRPARPCLFRVAGVLIDAIAAVLPPGCRCRRPRTGEPKRRASSVISAGLARAGVVDGNLVSAEVQHFLGIARRCEFRRPRRTVCREPRQPG